MKLERTEKYLLLIDEEDEIKLGDYCLFEGKVLRLRTSWSILYKCKIIAWYPLTKEAKELDLPLLPPFPVVSKIDIQGMAIEKYGDNYWSVDKLTAFEEGYKAAQAKQFSLEDVKKAIEMARLMTDDGVEDAFDTESISGLTELCTYGLRDKYTGEEIIQSLSTSQQLPVSFEPIPAYQWNKTCNSCHNGFDLTEKMGVDYTCPWCASPFHSSVLYEGWETKLNSEGKEVIKGQYKY